jgi:hypothetical protein
VDVVIARQPARDVANSSRTLAEGTPCNSAGGAVVLGHELGHLLGLSDEDELIGLGVVTLVENNIRAQLKLPLRPSNHGIPISQFPGFPTTEVYGFFEAWMRSY